MPANVVVSRRASDNTLWFYYGAPGSTRLVNIAIPTGVNVYPRRPDKVYSKRRHYIVGPPSRGLVFLEQGKSLVLIGLTAPASAPTLADGGAGSLTGNMIGYVTAIHKIGSTVVHESNGGPASSTLSITNRTVDWSAIPAVAGETRQTHWGLYRSVDGDTPQLVTELAVGTTTYHDTVATGARGRPIPTNNGVPPLSRFIEKYHQRAWYVPVDNPERVYFSEIDNFEAVGDSSYIPTQSFAAVNAIRRREDQLCVFGREVFYDIQGYTEEDYVMREIDPKVGSISHFATLLIDKRIWFPSVMGAYVYNGAALNYVMSRVWPFWREHYAAHTSDYNDAEAVNDRTEHVYKLKIVLPNYPRSFYYIGHYDGIDPSAEQPPWGFDKRGRADSAIGALDLGDGRQEYYAGSCDGVIRRENDETNADDDGDAFGKEMLIATGSLPIGRPIGGISRGGAVKQLNLMMRSDAQNFQITGYGGGPGARLAAVSGRWGPYTITAGAVAGAVPKEDFPLRPVGFSGKYVTFDVRIATPVGVKFFGYGLTATVGPDARSKTT